MIGMIGMIGKIPGAEDAVEDVAEDHPEEDPEEDAVPVEPLNTGFAGETLSSPWQEDMEFRFLNSDD